MDVGDAGSRRLQGQVAIVTGGGRGLGRAIAEAFAMEGSRVVLVARTLSQLEETAATIRRADGEALTVACDVTANGVAEQAMQAALASYGRIDTLILCAGVSITRSALDVTPDDWDYVVNINLKSAFFWAQAAAKRMLGAKCGSIIFLSSVTGQIGMPWLIPYTASKAGLSGLTRGLAAEWGNLGVRVNSIAAGFVKTDLTATEFADERLVKRITQRAPLGRLGKPEEIAATAVFLASNEAAYINGHLLVVDGGFLAA